MRGARTSSARKARKYQACSEHEEVKPVFEFVDGVRAAGARPRNHVALGQGKGTPFMQAACERDARASCAD